MRERKLLRARNCNCFTFGLADLPSHFLDTLLLHEPQHYHAPLFGRQGIDESKQGCPPFHFFKFHALGPGGFYLLRPVCHILAALALPAIRNQICSNPEQPRRKRNPTPFKPFQVQQRMMKYLGS